MKLLLLLVNPARVKPVTSLSILQLLPSSSAHYKNGEILFSEDGNDPEDLNDIAGKVIFVK